MHKKDYELLARVIRPQVDNARTIALIEGTDPLVGDVVSSAMAKVVQTIAYNLVQHLKADNERFDHLRFYDACGFNVEGNYPVVFDNKSVGV